MKLKSAKSPTVAINKESLSVKQNKNSAINITTVAVSSQWGGRQTNMQTARLKR